MRTGRALLGVVVAATASFLLFAPRERIAALGSALQVSWPYALIALAAINVLLSLLKNGRWIAPSLLALVGTTGVIWQSMADSLSADVIWDTGLALLILLGSTLAVSASISDSNNVSAIALTRSIALDRDIADRVRIQAVLAELSVDLSQSTWSGQRAIHARAIMGRVQVTVPRNAPILIVDGGMGVALGDTGLPRRTTTSASNLAITLHLAGLLGRVDIIRL